MLVDATSSDFFWPTTQNGALALWMVGKPKGTSHLSHAQGSSKGQSQPEFIRCGRLGSTHWFPENCLSMVVVGEHFAFLLIVVCRG